MILIDHIIFTSKGMEWYSIFGEAILIEIKNWLNEKLERENIRKQFYKVVDNAIINFK